MAFKYDKVKGMLAYVFVKNPADGYQENGAPPKPKEWKASVVLTDEDFVDDFAAEAKAVNAKISLKKFKSAEFETIFKAPPPEGAGKNVWVLTFKKSTELGSTGKPVPDVYKPRVYEKVGSTLVDITETKIPGTGSTGVVSIDVFERKNGSTSLYLKNVLVTDMIEFIEKEKVQPGNEFDDELESLEKALVDKTEPDDDDEMLPF